MRYTGSESRQDQAEHGSYNYKQEGVMYLILLCVGLIIFSKSIPAISFYVLKYNDSKVENFSLMMFIVGIVFLIAMLSVVPIHRANIRSQYLKYEEMKASVENMSQMEGYEKASIYRDVIQMNTNIEQAKYYARSKWTNWFFDPIIFEMTPIRFEK
jgi:type III secretory pathway component EscR